ncbi:hypothetical protein [Sphingomonas elodea]|uniref:hypothetical protein n=1 Tax=Sphingomonas elodea TaxID=179878 RepID=UPI000263027C|nr:hypothetical protein [Sphingomonas elodea]
MAQHSLRFLPLGAWPVLVFSVLDRTRLETGSLSEPDFELGRVPRRTRNRIGRFLSAARGLS